MNTKKDLQWWLEFAQKDLGRAKKKTRERLKKELNQKVAGYSNLVTDPTNDQIIPFIELNDYQQSAKKMVEKIISWLNGKDTKKLELIWSPEAMWKSELTIKVAVNIDSSGTLHVTTLTGEHTGDTAETWMLMLMGSINKNDFRFCPQCGKLFLRVSQNKKYCTRYCAVNASKR